MTLEPIPAGCKEIQPGLWAEEVHYTFHGEQKMRYNIYAARGYRFWNVQQPENYDEEGALLPVEQRTMLSFANTACRSVDELNSNFVSVAFSEVVKE